MSHNQQLLRELEQALATQATLKQQRADMIHTVATSPSKKKKVPAPKPRPQPAKRQSKQQLNSSGRHHAAQQRKPKPSSRTTIPAFRPPSPTDSQDTVGREIDAHITKSVANMLQTPVPSQQAPRIVPLPAVANTRAEQQQAMTPTFLTSKRRNMHCELDEPGYGVPFPHRKSKGFFARLFSCFGPSQTRGGGGGGGGPPSPFLMRTPTRPRPPSARVTPPTLKLTSEMAPLRQSLASLKPGLAAAALADGGDGSNGDGRGNGNIPSSAMTLLSDQHPLSGGTPPTPQFGNNSHFPPRPHEDAWISQGDALATTPLQDGLHSEASFESLEPELSDNEEGGMATPGAAMYRRTPVAGADGRPMVQRRRQPSPKEPAPIPVLEANAQMMHQMQQQRHSTARAAESAHAMQLQAALLHALNVPLPPGAGPMVRGAMRSNGGSPHGGEVKQTQVTLAALMGSNNNRNNNHSAGAAAGAVSYHNRYHHQQQKQQQQGGYQDIRSAPVSPLKNPKVTSVVGRSNTASQRHHTVPHAPIGASAAPIPSLQEQQHQQQSQVSRRPQVKSAPTSRAVSPLRQPTIKPRMTKASAARSDATQRLLETRRKREISHLANLHPRAAKRKEEAMLNHTRCSTYNGIINNNNNDEGIQVKRPRSAENPPPPSFNNTNNNSNRNAEGQVYVKETSIARNSGFQIPAAGTQAASFLIPGNDDLVAGVDAASVPPRSPGFYHMLERLALGMSVDMARVEEAKKPTKPFVPMEELVEGGGKNQSGSGGGGGEINGFVLNPNALYSGKAELSPLVNVAAQKLVSLSDAVVARSASGSVVATNEEEPVAAVPTVGSSHPAANHDGGIAVDASSGTLLGQLMELERSLTLDDLAALRHAIRREGGDADAWTD